MQDLNTLYGDGITDQGAVKTASELLGMARRIVCARATQSHTEPRRREGVKKKREKLLQSRMGERACVSSERSIEDRGSNKDSLSYIIKYFPPPTMTTVQKIKVCSSFV